ncbi:MAG: hypothetical protein Q4G33_02130 [bacterium]|nr:hypothetical protein [bacterium]
MQKQIFMCLEQWKVFPKKCGAGSGADGCFREWSTAVLKKGVMCYEKKRQRSNGFREN